RARGRAGAGPQGRAASEDLPPREDHGLGRVLVGLGGAVARTVRHLEGRRHALVADHDDAAVGHDRRLGFVAADLDADLRVLLVAVEIAARGAALTGGDVEAVEEGGSVAAALALLRLPGGEGEPLALVALHRQRGRGDEAAAVV